MGNGTIFNPVTKTTYLVKKGKIVDYMNKEKCQDILLKKAEEILNEK